MAGCDPVGAQATDTELFVFADDASEAAALSSQRSANIWPRRALPPLEWVAES